jgi:hypothetical protein
MPNLALVADAPKSLETVAEMEETGAASLCPPVFTVFLLKQFGFPFFWTTE